MFLPKFLMNRCDKRGMKEMDGEKEKKWRRGKVKDGESSYTERKDEEVAPVVLNSYLW